MGKILIIKGADFSEVAVGKSNLSTPTYEWIHLASGLPSNRVDVGKMGEYYYLTADITDLHGKVVNTIKMYLTSDQLIGDQINIFKRTGTTFDLITTYTVTSDDTEKGYLIVRIPDTSIASENESFAFNNTANGYAGGYINNSGTASSHVTYYTRENVLKFVGSKFEYCIDFGYFA